jgi:hypothetical protein
MVVNLTGTVKAYVPERLIVRHTIQSPVNGIVRLRWLWPWMHIRQRTINDP